MALYKKDPKVVENICDYGPFHQYYIEQRNGAFELFTMP
jgi:hypothetical protein